MGKAVKYTVRVVLLLLLVLFLAFLCLPPMGVKSASRRTSAKNDVIQIVNAVRNYYVDYSHYPKVTENGFCEMADSNARLIRILTAEDPEANPRRIRYIEPPRSRIKKGKHVSAIDPETGAWVDPWGNFYRIRMATEWDGVKNPHTGDGPNYLETGVIAWSVGKYGVQGRKDNPLTKNGSGDVVSWE